MDDNKQMVKIEPTPPAPAKSVLTDEDKRELTMAVKQTSTEIMNPVEYEQTRILVKDLIKSGAMPNTVRNVEQGMVMVCAGREMGMTPFEAIHDLYFVNGRLNIYGKATPTMLRKAGWRIKQYEEDAEHCTATVYHPQTGETITDTFTFEDAELSGFTKDNKGFLKFGWRLGANRKRKLRYGVLSQIIHTYIPEVLGSCSGIGDYSEDYNDAQSIAERQAEAEGKAKKLSKLQKLAGAEEAEVSDENN